MTGRVPFQKVMVKSHYTLLKNELDARGIKYDATREHFTQLKKKLRHDEIKKRENFNDAQFEQLLVDILHLHQIHKDSK